ncbi:hypothetical protein C2S19_03925 [Helicobacter pylori]|nr:hypothetical protein C2S19_03925 [Helicobacter pylori]
MFLPTLFVFAVFTDSITNLFLKNNPTFQNYIMETNTKNPLKLDQPLYYQCTVKHGLSILFLTWLQRSKWGSRYQGLKKWK